MDVDSRVRMRSDTGVHQVYPQMSDTTEEGESLLRDQLSEVASLVVAAGILGTSGRECKHSSYNSDSCDLLCCGRGYNTRLERRMTQCHCKFVWCCQVNCKECIEDVQVHTCK
ncbi:hypothetical protein Q1695_005102 [Nippostrongylus brasiliensis]|nr:hypothetical protein Q1695_005102 [Nippostrongylus brasiliensis]